MTWPAGAGSCASTGVAAARTIVRTPADHRRPNTKTSRDLTCTNVQSADLEALARNRIASNRLFERFSEVVRRHALNAARLVRIAVRAAAVRSRSGIRAAAVCQHGVKASSLTSPDDILDRCDDRLMAKVTGKFQITLPKALAERCGIRVGDDLELRPVGRSIQIDKRPPTTQRRDPATAWRTSIAPPSDNALANVRRHGSRRNHAAGRGRSSTLVAALVDTNILVYRFDPRFPDKQARATQLLRTGIVEDSIRDAASGTDRVHRRHDQAADTKRCVAAFTRRCPTRVGRDAGAVRDPLPGRGVGAGGHPRRGDVTGSRGSTRTCGRMRSDSDWTRSGRRTSRTAGCTAVCESEIRSRNQPDNLPSSHFT